MRELVRKVLIVFFLTHIPATLLVDSQAVLPPHLVPDFARRLLAWHVAQTGDPLMDHVAPGRPPFPAWFKALVVGELALQLPFFFVAVYAFSRRRSWVRLPALAYGVHTATTLLPIFAELVAAAPADKLPALLAIYFPYFALPLACVWLMWSPTPFGAPSDARKKTR